jgi:chemotaxis protein CheC
MRLKPSDVDILRVIVSRALADSSASLSDMTDGRIRLSEPKFLLLPLNIVPCVAGGPEQVVVAAYVAVNGDVSGHGMLLFEEEKAFRLVDLLCGYPAGTTRQLGPLELSAIAEAANVIVSSYVNAIADVTGLKLLPTVPAVVMDMAGAILESVATELYLNGDEVFVAETEFSGELSGRILLMPNTESMARLIATLEGIQ